MNKYLLSLFILIFSTAYSQSITELDSLFHLFATSDSDTEKIILLNKISRGYISTNADKSLEYSNEALNLSLELDWQKGIALSYDNLGNIYYYNIQDLPRASDYYHKALAIREEIQDSAGLADSYMHLGNISYLKEDYKTAEKHYLKNITIATKLNDPDIRTSHINLASIYIWEKEYDKAIEAIDISIAQNMDKTDKYGLSVSYIRKGTLFYEMGQMDSVLEWYYKAHTIRNQIKDSLGITYTQNLIAKFLIEIGELHKADSIVKTALNSALNQNRFYQIELALQSKIKLLELDQNYEAATDAYKQLLSNKDSVLNLEHIQKISEIELQYAFDNDLKIMELASRKNKLQTTLIIFGLIIIIIVVIFLFYFQKNKAKTTFLENQNLALKNKQLNTEIELGKKEVSANLLRLAEKNEVITEVVEKIQLATAKFKPENKKFLNDLIAELDSNVTKNIWQRFENSFQKIHSEFYNKLENKHPDLTPGERRLCAFLKLNFSTKDIANITHLSVKSIETSRVRLRKKLGLANQKMSLIQYISKF